MENEPEERATGRRGAGPDPDDQPLDGLPARGEVDGNPPADAGDADDQFDDGDREFPELDLGPSDPLGTHAALPPKIEAWRRRSAAGAVLTGFALGLQEALEKRKEEPAIIMETSGEPPKDLPVEADFEYGRPRQSVVQIRPWLLTDAPTVGSEADGESDGAAKDEGGK